MTKFANESDAVFLPSPGGGGSIAKRSGWGDCSSAAYPPGFGRLAPHPVAL